MRRLKQEISRLRLNLVSVARSPLLMIVVLCLIWLGLAINTDVYLCVQGLRSCRQLAVIGMQQIFNLRPELVSAELVLISRYTYYA